MGVLDAVTGGATRRLAVAAAYGGGGVGLAGALAAGVLLGQARLARAAIPLAEAPPPRCDGRYGQEYPGQPLRLAVLGDSSAAGYGVQRPRDTPGALLAAGLAQRLHRPVLVRCVAVVGATSPTLSPQVELATAFRPDLAVILVGGNDVTHRIRVTVATRYLAQAVRELRAGGTRVVVGTCPDLGAIRPIQPPLRWLARRWSRELAAAQTVAVVRAGGSTVSLGDLIGPVFVRDPHTMFAADRFHPSADGYATACAAILPTLLSEATAATAGPAPAGAGGAGRTRGEALRGLVQAALEAARNAGTEVTAAGAAGWGRGPAGLWVSLRHRVRLLTERRQDPAPAGVAEPG